MKRTPRYLLTRTMVLFLLFPLFPHPIFAQESPPFRVMFWNVENLFDCQKDSLKHDEEFLPSSLRAWHYRRYKKKLADVARVITAVGEWDAPVLAGLCEVENDRVMHDLTRYSPLKEHGYRYVMTDSPDERGIDVALLYRRDRFKLLSCRSIQVSLPAPNRRPTRDILHVTGSLLCGDTLDVFVCHFPSRSSGKKETEPYRLFAAGLLKKAADSLAAVRFRPLILIMGDLNDHPNDKSVANVLAAHCPSDFPKKENLYHLLARKAKNPNFGTHKYQGEWGWLDHLIVSGSLLDSSSKFYTDESKADAVRLPFLLIKDEKHGGVQPFRTYHGMKYHGGYSDHLPVFADFVEVL